MLARFLQFIKKHALFQPSDSLLVAVSGGIDSMVLCHLLKAGGFHFSIAHCNFQLRGEASDLDASVVKAYAAQMPVPYYEKRFETASVALEQGVSIQMAARDLRYAWFESLKYAEGFDYLLTAHHLNDSVETMLMNFAKGTSIHGLTGIDFKSNWLRRPLSIFNKTELIDFAKAAELVWREDQSNQENKYYRNAIRNLVVPELEKLNASFLKNAGLLALKNRAVEKVWLAHIEEVKSKHVKKEGEDIIIEKAPFVSGELSDFALFELLVGYGANFTQVQNVIDSLSQVGLEFPMKSWLLLIERNELRLSKAGLAEQSEVLVNEITPHVSVRGFSLHFSKSEGPIEFEKGKEYLSLKKMNFPLTIRKWQQGDKMKPLGMQGHKLISDILIDRKVERSQKDETYVLLSGDKICYLIGHQISQDFSLNKKDEMALIVSISEAD